MAAAEATSAGVAALDNAEPVAIESAEPGVTPMDVAGGESSSGNGTIAAEPTAEAEEGVYHFNIFLTLELSSDHFKSGKSSESFGIIVLRSNEDGVLSFAIDDFPEMTEASIEQFWINMVEEHRRKRNLKFLEVALRGTYEGFNT